MLETLATAETMFWQNLECVSNCGQVPDVREAAISLTLIQSFQASLGRDPDTDARVAVGLLGMSNTLHMNLRLNIFRRICGDYAPS